MFHNFITLHFQVGENSVPTQINVAHITNYNKYGVLTTDKPGGFTVVESPAEITKLINEVNQRNAALLKNC